MLCNPEWSYTVEVRHGEAGADGKATLSALGNWFQEAAGQDAGRLGFGEELLAARGKSWILTRLCLWIDALPCAGDPIRIRTWPSRLDHLGYRGYELWEREKLLVRATSAWTVLDLTTRRLCPLPDDLVAAYPLRTLDHVPFESRVLPRLAAPQHSAPIVARHDDLDSNGHVNNARYLSWVLECLPRAPGAGLIPSFLDVSFRAECFPGDRLDSLCGPAPQAPGVLLHAVRRESGPDACRAVSRWKEPKA